MYNIISIVCMYIYVNIHSSKLTALNNNDKLYYSNYILMVLSGKGHWCLDNVVCIMCDSSDAAVNWDQVQHTGMLAVA